MKRAAEDEPAEETPRAPSPKRASLSSSGSSSGSTSSSVEDEAIGVEEGFQIEVLWTLEDEDTGDKTEHWWFATVQQKTGLTHDFADEEDPEDLETRAVWQIIYDAFLPQFPEQESRDVSFASDHLLYDIESEDLMFWRRRGEEWDAHKFEEQLREAQDTPNAVVVPNAQTLVGAVMSDIIQRHGHSMESLNQPVNRSR